MKAEAGAEPHPRLSPSVLELAPWWIGICLIAALAWVVTIAWAGPMGVGPGTMGRSLPAFLPIWVLMMAAMMFPSVAPTAVVWIRSATARPATRDRVVGITSFLAGYLLAWTAFGTAVYGVLVGAARLVADAPHAARWAGVAIFGAAGVYQLTPAKGACLRHCRSPLGSLFHYASYRAPARDLRVGFHHGLYCVGCCWGLMIVLVAVGAMNVAVMVALAGVILIEKVWLHGAAFSRAVGVSLLVVAALVPLAPWLLPGLVAAPM